MKILFNLLFIFVICVSNINAEKIMISDELRKFVNGDKIRYQILYQIPYKNSIWLEAVPEGSEKAATEGVKVNGVKGSELKFIDLISERFASKFIGGYSLVCLAKSNNKKYI